MSGYLVVTKYTHSYFHTEWDEGDEEEMFSYLSTLVLDPEFESVHVQKESRQ